MGNRSHEKGPRRRSGEGAATHLATPRQKSPEVDSGRRKRPDDDELVAALAQHETHVSIARRFGVHRSWVGEMAKRAEIQDAVKAIHRETLEKAKEAIKAKTLDAARVMFEMLDSPDDRVRLDAAVKLLSKAGADAPSKHEGKSEVTGKDGSPLVPPELTIAQARARLAELEAIHTQDRQALDAMGIAMPEEE